MLNASEPTTMQISGQEGWLAPALSSESRCLNASTQRCRLVVRKGGLPPLFKCEHTTMQISGQEGWLAPAVQMRAHNDADKWSGRVACPAVQMRAHNDAD